MSNYPRQSKTGNLGDHRYAHDMRVDAEIHETSACLARLEGLLNGSEIVGQVEDLREALRREQVKILRRWG